MLSPCGRLKVSAGGGEAADARPGRPRQTPADQRQTSGRQRFFSPRARGPPRGSPGALPRAPRAPFFFPAPPTLTMNSHRKGWARWAQGRVQRRRAPAAATIQRRVVHRQRTLRIRPTRQRHRPPAHVASGVGAGEADAASRLRDGDRHEDVVLHVELEHVAPVEQPRVRRLALTRER